MSRRGRDVRRAEITLRPRSSSSSSRSRSRTPVFLRREDPRGGELVLRSRKVETGYVRRRSSSSSSSERRVSPERRRERVVLRGRSPRVCLERDRSVSPDDNVVILSRHSSPSPARFRAKIAGTARRAFSRESSPESSQRIRRPTIEREVITHWRDVDHGLVRAASLSPVPAAWRKHRNTISKDTDIDIDVSHAHERGRHHTDVDIDIHHSHSPLRRKSRSRSRSHFRRKSVERLPPASHFHDDTEIVIRSDRDRLRFEAESRRRKHRRSRSASVIPSPSSTHSEEADYITSRIDARGRMGEAWNGHTRDWTIVDVPPGTERVQLDGVGGGAAEVTWPRYSGVRRSKFIPERDEHSKIWVGDSSSAASSPLVVAPGLLEKGKDCKMNVSIYDKDREVEIEASRQRARTNERWTEITKDLISREAIKRMGYEYEETEWFFYIMEYLKYEDVVELVNLSDKIREARRRHRRAVEWEREFGDHHHHHIDITATHKHRRRSRSRSKH